MPRAASTIAPISPAGTRARGRGEFRLGMGAITELARDLGLRPGRQTITPAIERARASSIAASCAACSTPNGSVQGNADSRACRCASRSSDLDLLEGAQRMLLRLGIASSMYRSARSTNWSSPAKTSRVSRRSSASPTRSSARACTRLLGNYKRTLNRERFVATVESVRADGMEDVYDVQIPGINEFDANGFHAHNCGEQPLPPYGSCLLGSVNLTRFVKNAFTDFAEFDWNEYREVVKVFTRMLDNVCEINGLPLEQQRDEIMRKRRHGMGFLGLGSTITCLGMKYGAEDSIKFTEDVSREMAVAGWEAALDLAKEKGPAPIMKEEFTRHRRDAAQASGNGEGRLEDRRPDSRAASCTRATASYMQRVAETAPWLVDQLANVGARFTHHTLDRAHRHHLAVAGQQRQQRHRAVVRAPLFPQRHPPRQEEQGES